MIEVCLFQIRDNFKNLKFVISFLLIVVLFILNALFFSFRTENRLFEYNKLEKSSEKAIRESSGQLNDLIFTNHLLIKKPLNSEFIINGNQDVFPDGFILNVKGINLPEKVFQDNEGNFNLPPIDWFFIISIILLFLIFTLTYDSISGEKELGTFKLVFSNSINKLEFLIGKITGISMSVMIPILLGILLNIFIIIVLGKITFDSKLFVQILFLIFYTMFYVMFFVTLGMFISFISNNSLKSLIICSLLWIVLVVIIPVVVKITITNLYVIPSKNDYEIELQEADNRLVEFLSKYDAGSRGVEAGKIDDYRKEKGEALAQQELENLKQKITNSYLEKKFSQANLFYNVLSISPVYLFQSTLEKLFGTGLERDKKFYKKVREFQLRLVNFYRDEDEKDPSSPNVHFLYNYLSTKAIAYSNIPKFEENADSAISLIIKSSSAFVFLFLEFVIILGVICILFFKAVLS